MVTPLIDDTQVFLPDVWSANGRFRAKKTALVCGSIRLSWADINRESNKIANALLDSGITKGARVGLFSTNCIEMALIVLGVIKSGACLVPISTMLTEKQVGTIIADANIALVFAGLGLCSKLDDVLASPEIPSHLRSLTRIAVEHSDDLWTGFHEWKAHAKESDPHVLYDLSDEMNIIYSSGTTGSPKGIVQTHRSRQHWSYSNAIELRMSHATIALATTPLYSNGTWFMFLPALFVGGTVVLMESFNVDEFLKLVEREKATHTFMVPTQYISLLESGKLKNHDTSSLNYMLSAGSPMRQDTKDRVLNEMGKGLFELYGFSEGFATICRPEEHSKKGSVGTPVVGFDLRIIGKDDKEVDTGAHGEIVGYGGGLMKQYNNQNTLTQDTIWLDERGRTFIRSGDIGKLDGDGYLYILDRKKDMILSGGFNVFPKDIEEILGQHPSIIDVTVIGAHDDYWGEVPIAIIIPKANTIPDVAKIKSWANERLAKTQQVKDIIVVEEFPRNALGKVLKKDLREHYGKFS